MSLILRHCGRAAELSRRLFLQVLPLTEDNAGGNSNLFEIDEKEVRVEVMRARGAGGQVRCLFLPFSTGSLPPHFST